MYKIIAIILLFILLLGCATPAPKSIVEVTTIVIAPEDSKILDCVSPPLFSSEYSKQTYEVKEQWLFKALMDQYAAMTACNVRWSQLREWYKQQKALYVK